MTNLKPVQRLVVGLLLFSASSCTLAKVDVNVVSERTSLENQVLGSYNTLNEAVLLVASVRGVSPTGKVEVPPVATPEQQEATRALELLAFHSDDIERFLRLGWVGENREATLTPLPRPALAVAPEELRAFAANYSSAEFDAVVTTVNRARELLMQRVVRVNENFTAADLPAIRRVFAELNRQKAPAGSQVQEEDGQWRAR